MNPSAGLAAFLAKIETDPALLDSLRQEKSPTVFAEACVRAAENLGLRVDAAEVAALLRERALAWHQRHIL